jgi:hypothetical protein
LISSYSHKVIQLYRPEERGILFNEGGVSSMGDLEVLIQQNSNGKTGMVRLFHLPPRRIQEDLNGKIKRKYTGGLIGTIFSRQLPT